MRRLVIGDIHGNYKGMLQVMQRANFKSEEDTLYLLGDYVDGHSESKKVMDLISMLPNKVAILGNHDSWFLEYLKGNRTFCEPHWYNHGGRATLESYGRELASMKFSTFVLNTNGSIPDAHQDFIESCIRYHITDDNIALAHGGFDLQDRDWTEANYYWDRHMWEVAKMQHSRREKKLARGMEPELVDEIQSEIFSKYKKIFIGHTPVHTKDNPDALPQKALNVWNLDTGGGWFGKITIMDMDTEEYWQSDFATDLYPDFKGR